MQLKPDEIQRFKNFQSQYTTFTLRLGEVYLQRKNLDALEKNLNTAVEELQDNQQSYLKMLQAYYGAGTVDINTWEFTPHLRYPDNGPVQSDLPITLPKLNIVEP
jgi:hypothetical protein